MQVIPISGLSLNFSGTDILHNSWTLLMLLGTFVVLAMAVPFTSQLVSLIKRIFSDVNYIEEIDDDVDEEDD